MKYIIILYIIFLLIATISLLAIPKIIEQSILSNKQNKNQNTETANKLYNKRSLLTEYEKIFLRRLQRIFKSKYYIQAQVPLRMIIHKNGEELGKYANELHKYIDYGLLNKDYEIIALIEFNDKTHNQIDRIERDEKVKNILNEAEIPLIIFTSDENLTDKEIKERIYNSI